jgi:hypothetical protein
MTPPISLSGFADVARRCGNTVYVPHQAPPPTMKAVGPAPDGPPQAIALPATFLKLRNRSADTNPKPGPLDVAACDPLDANAHQPLPEKACSGGPGLMLPPTPYRQRASALETASSAHADLVRTVCVPDQLDLARRCSAEIQLLTYRCAIGRLADPRQVRFAMCAGRKQKLWKTRLIRLPFVTETEDFTKPLKEKWQMVAEFHWGVSSAEITRRLVRSVGATPEEIPEPDPGVDEWDMSGDGGRFVTGQPWQQRAALERDKARPHGTTSSG